MKFSTTLLLFTAALASAAPVAEASSNALEVSAPTTARNPVDIREAEPKKHHHKDKDGKKKDSREVVPKKKHHKDKGNKKHDNREADAEADPKKKHHHKDKNDKKKDAREAEPEAKKKKHHHKDESGKGPSE